MKAKKFLTRFGIGACIGIAMIIPGISGGTVAVMFGIYDKLICVVNSLRCEFKKSFSYLFPIVIGAIIAVAAMYFPLRYALEYAPLPTVLLFVGLMIGSIPKLIKEGLRNGLSKLNVISVLIPFVSVVGICFIPSLGNVNLGADMPIYGYILLVFVGMLASCALVVPGVSGFMLLLIFGYYKPLLDTVSAIITSLGHSLIVLLLFALGIVIGFFFIAKLMKMFLSKFPRGTYWAIIGFVFGSIPAVFITFDYSAAKLGMIQIIVGILLCVLGSVCSYILMKVADKKSKHVESE